MMLPPRIHTPMKLPWITLPTAPEPLMSMPAPLPEMTLPRRTRMVPSGFSSLIPPIVLPGELSISTPSPTFPTFP